MLAINYPAKKKEMETKIIWTYNIHGSPHDHSTAAMKESKKFMTEL